MVPSPRLKRPKDNLSKPKSDEEKIFCWYYWIEAILNPAMTRKVLDQVDRIPEFEASWGADWESGDEFMNKLHPKH